MKLIFVLLASTPSFGSVPMGEHLSALILEKSAEKIKFPVELGTVSSLRWACQIEEDTKSPPKSCLKLLQILENAFGEHRPMERKKLLHALALQSKTKQIEDYKSARRRSGTTDE